MDALDDIPEWAKQPVGATPAPAPAAAAPQPSRLMKALTDSGLVSETPEEPPNWAKGVKQPSWSQAPMTWRRGAELTGRGAAEGVYTAAGAPLETDALGNTLLNASAQKAYSLTGGKERLPTLNMGPLDFIPGVQPLRQLASKYLGSPALSPSGLLDQGLTQAGVAAPQNAAENIYVKGLQGLVGGGVGGRSVLSALSGLTGSTAMAGAKEAGLGPVPQVALGTLASLIPGAGASSINNLYRMSSPRANVAAPVGRPPPNVSPEIANVISLGLRMPPTEAESGIIPNVAEGLSGQARLERALSTMNTPTINQRAAEDVNIDLSRYNGRIAPAVQQAVSQNQGAARQIESLGTMKVDDVFRHEAEAIANPGHGTLPGPVNPEIQALKDYYSNLQSFDSYDAVARIRQLRSDGFAHVSMYDPPKNALGRAQLKLANELEDQIDRNLIGTEHEGLLDQFRAERIRLAKLNSIENSIVGGNVDTSLLAAQQKNGVPLDGNLLKLAQANQYMSRSMQVPAKIRNGSLMSTPEGAMAVLAPHFGSGFLDLAAGRPLLRALLSSDLVQKYGIQKQGLSNAIPVLRTLSSRYTEPQGQGWAGGLESRTGNPVRDQFADYIRRNYPEARERYEAFNDPQLGTTDGGRILSTDTAMELSPDYSGNRTLGPSVRDGAQHFIDRLYQEKLMEPTPPDKKNMVLFVMGGPGSGRAAAVQGWGLPEAQKLVNQAKLVYMGDMATPQQAFRKVRDAVAAGNDAQVIWVYRDPAEAMRAGVLPKATANAGPSVSAETHAAAHTGAGDSFNRLQWLTGYNPQTAGRVSYAFIDNGGGVGQARMGNIAEGITRRYNVKPEELKYVANTAYKAGAIPRKIHQATVGPGTNSTGAGGAGSASSGAPAVTRGRPQQQLPGSPAQGPKQVAPGAPGTGLLNTLDEVPGHGAAESLYERAGDIGSLAQDAESPEEQESPP